MMPIFTRKWLGALGLASALVLCATAGPSWTQSSGVGPRPAPPSPPQQEPGKLNPVLVGVVFGVLVHEMGHMVIEELSLPAVGPEEDVADEFAAMVYVYNIRHNARFRDLSLWAARLWREMGLKEADSVAKVLRTGWFDEHSIDAVRYGKMLCVLYGGAQRQFAEEVTRTVPDWQQDHFRTVCKLAFTKKWAAWNELLRKHRRQFGDPELPADLPTDAPGKKMLVDYGWLDVPLASDLTKKLGAQLKESKILDNIAANFGKEYVLPEHDVTLYVRECDQFNAWYSPYQHSISLCLNIANEVAEYLLKGAPRPGGG